MPKYTNTPIGAGYNSNAAINAQFKLVEGAVNSCLFRDGSTPNSMSSNLDMDSNSILNVTNLDSQGLTIAGKAVTIDNLATTTLPAQAGHAGKYLTTDGLAASWAAFSALSYTLDETGAVARLFTDRFAERLSVKDFGAIGDGVTDDSAAIQAASNAAGELGKVYFPKATVEYVFSTTITVPGSQTWEGEVDWNSTRTPLAGMSRLRYIGTTVAISCKDMQMINMIIMGNINTSFSPNLGVGINNTGVLRLTGTTVRGFTTGVDIDGGFYHVFTRCNFFHNNTCFSFGAANNVNFTDCRFDRFDVGVTSTGGSGMVAFKGCSFEQWTDQIYQHLAGATTSVSLNQCYVENYPNNAIAAGLTDTGGTGFYDKANGLTTGLVTSVKNTYISCKGIKRFIVGSGKDLLDFEGNRWDLYAAGAISPNETEYLINQSAPSPKMFFQKDSYRFFDSAGAVAATYAASGIVITEQILTASGLTEYYDYITFNRARITSLHNFNFQEDDYTLTEDDNGKHIGVYNLTVGVPTTITVPPGLPIGFACTIVQLHIHSLEIIEGSGVLIQSSNNSFTTGGKYSHVQLVASNEFATRYGLHGDLQDITENLSSAGASYTLDENDLGKSILFTSGSAVTLTVPTGLSVGFNCKIIQGGAGAVTATASGTTINSRGGLLATNGQHAVMTLESSAADVFYLSGDRA